MLEWGRCNVESIISKMMMSLTRTHLDVLRQTLLHSHGHLPPLLDQQRLLESFLICTSSIFTSFPFFAPYDQTLLLCCSGTRGHSLKSIRFFFFFQKRLTITSPAILLQSLPLRALNNQIPRHKAGKYLFLGLRNCVLHWTGVWWGLGVAAMLVVCTRPKVDQWESSV